MSPFLRLPENKVADEGSLETIARVRDDPASEAGSPADGLPDVIKHYKLNLKVVQILELVSRALTNGNVQG